jgi:hypothetical protein
VESAKRYGDSSASARPTVRQHADAGGIDVRSTLICVATLRRDMRHRSRERHPRHFMFNLGAHWGWSASDARARQ